jgi:Kdo2-lipid IVA lauroyltransferase/acyltransferase
MEAIGYYIFYGFNWLLTLLPLRILYVFSDLLFLVLYYFPGYRRKVVRTNLKNSFPEKSEKEIIDIERKFYHHLCDLFVETFKLTHMSSSQLMRRIPLTNPELLEKLYNEGRDVAAVLGHYGNWEMLTCLPLYSKYKFVSIYKPLANKHFDKYMINSRSKFGMTVTPMQHVVREVIENRKNNTRALYSFLTDQTPPKGDIKFWTNFLSQVTPVYLGTEKIASKYDMAVILFNVQKIKRGRYSFTVELLFDHTAGLPEHLITETHVKRLEEIIREHPEFWIWSHRRWKHKRELPDG